MVCNWSWDVCNWSRSWYWNIGRSAMDALARQPEASGDIPFKYDCCCCTLIEGASLFAIVTCLLVDFYEIIYFSNEQRVYSLLSFNLNFLWN